MNRGMLEYIETIRPEPHQNGRELLLEGIKIGKSLKAGKSRFARESNYSSYLDYKKEMESLVGRPKNYKRKK